MAATTKRQDAWAKAANDAARDGNLAAGLFSLLALPNGAERGHVCQGIDLGGFTRDGRRGIKCRICDKVVRWVDPEEGA